MADIGIGYRDETVHDTHHWVELSDDYQITRPCVIVLGGDGVWNAIEANGYIKQIEQMAGVTGIPLADRPFDIIAPYYKYFYNLQIERLYLLSQKGCASKGTHEQTPWKKDDYIKRRENPTYVRELYERLFQPLISGKAGTERLSTEQAAHNLRRVNIISHSHGAYVTLKLQDNLDKDMRRLGYTRTERDFALSRIKWVSCAGTCVPFGFSKMDTVHFSSLNDEMFLRYQDRDKSFPWVAKQQIDIKQDQNVVIPISRAEHIWLTERFSNNEEGARYGDILHEEHLIQIFVGGAWKNEHKPGRQPAFVASALLQANIFDSLWNEEKPFPLYPWRKRLELPIAYRQGPHVVPPMYRLPDPPRAHRSAIDKLFTTKNRVNFTANRLTPAQQKEMIDAAVRKGEKYRNLSFVTDVNKIIRADAEQEVKKVPLSERRAFLTRFHQKYPHYRTALQKTR